MTRMIAGPTPAVTVENIREIWQYIKTENNYKYNKDLDYHRIVDSINQQGGHMNMAVLALIALTMKDKIMKTYSPSANIVERMRFKLARGLSSLEEAFHIVLQDFIKNK